MTDEGLVGNALQERGRVLTNRVVAPEHNVVTVATREIGRRAHAGQFAQISIPGSGVFLPRPFSFLAAGDDRCVFLSRAVGPGTQALAGVTEGAELDLLGPLGHGFDLAAAINGGELIVVGGGVGVPPLVHAATELAPFSGTALIGAARSELLLCTQEFADLGWKVLVATDDGSSGYDGLVTDLLEQALVRLAEREDRPPMVLACGPHPMLHRCAELAATSRASCQVAVEKPMACGFGVCLGCAIRMRVPADSHSGTTYALVCRDGPVFSADEIEW